MSSFEDLCTENQDLYQRLAQRDREIAELRAKIAAAKGEVTFEPICCEEFKQALRLSPGRKPMVLLSWVSGTGYQISGHATPITHCPWCGAHRSLDALIATRTQPPH